MYVCVKSSPNSPRKTVQIVESSRMNGKPRQKLIRYIGVAKDEETLKELKRVAEFLKADIEQRKSNQLNFFKPEQLAEMAIESKQAAKTARQKKALKVNLKNMREEQRCIVGIHEVYGRIYSELGFDRILRRPAAGNILKQIVLARIASPASKRASTAFLQRDYGIRLPLEKVYRMMDRINEEAIEQIQEISSKKTCSLLGEETLDVLFYDTTSLYFETEKEDPLREKGYSKDGKPNCSQVILALLVTKEGLPVGYRVFPGAQYEGNTLLPVLEELSQKHKIGHLVFVADSGLLNKKNLSLLEEKGYSYVVGARLKGRSLKKELLSRVLDKKRYKPLPGKEEEREKGIKEFFQEMEIPEKKGRRLIVTYQSKRAKKDAENRKEVIERLKKKLEKSKELSGVLSDRGQKKFLKIKGSSRVILDEGKIKEAERFDGLHGVYTNCKGEEAGVLLKHYHGLWRIEESFRVTKHDLRVRPMYHWTEDRIQAHIGICYMAFVCVRHLTYRYRLQYSALSPEAIREELLHLQVSVLRDLETKKRYAIPSRSSQKGRTIYKSMGLNWSEVPYEIRRKKDLSEK